ncbi:MAG: hypothetical protein GY856_43510 [bacterium]|nr:hypothetical protein [bacterium]
MVRKIGIFVASLVIGVFSAVAWAAPCRDDSWRPTYVHDLICDDGIPYYVKPDGSFAEVSHPYDANGPLFCEAEGVRDRRGFTTCQDYTRVQCGCDAKSWGNSTCAGFLAFRGHRRPGDSGGAVTLLGITSGGAATSDPGQSGCLDAKLLVFCASWAAPCAKLGAVLEKLESEGACVEQMDPQKDAAAAANWKPATIPTVVGLRCGREVRRIESGDEAAIRALWAELERLAEQPFQ